MTAPRYSMRAIRLARAHDRLGAPDDLHAKTAAELRRLHQVEQKWIALSAWVSRPLVHLHEVNMRVLDELQHVQRQLKARHGRWHPDVVRIRKFIQGGGAA